MNAYKLDILSNAVDMHNVLADSIYTACDEYLQYKSAYTEPRIVITLTGDHFWTATLCEKEEIPTDLLQNNTYELPITEDDEADPEQMELITEQFVFYEH